MLHNTKQIKQYNKSKLYDLKDMALFTKKIFHRGWKLTFDFSNF